jgi:phosphatidylinositol alpha-1,6-mannosyltransferase
MKSVPYGCVRGTPRLLISTTDFPPSLGGIQRVLNELTHRLAHRWSITVIAPNHEGSRSHDAQVPFAVHRTRATWADSRIAVLGDMTRLIARARPEIMLAGHLNALPPIVMAGRGRPTVAIIYGNEVWAPRTRLLTRMLGTRVERAMAISRFTASEAAKAGIPRERIVVTPLGASPPSTPDGGDAVLREMGLVSGERIVPFFLTVSRLTEPHKGHDMFLHALPSLLASCADVRYVVAGEGELAGDLSALATRLGVRHAVRMPGAVDERTKEALMANCRAFVMLSRELRRPALFEGFGISFIEAAMAGRPSLAGDSGGVPDAVLDGQTGLLVDPLSLPAVIKGALLLLEDPAYADALGERANARALRDYTWSAAIGRMERCMESVL